MVGTNLDAPKSIYDLDNTDELFQLPAPMGIDLGTSLILHNKICNQKTL